MVILFSILELYRCVLVCIFLPKPIYYLLSKSIFMLIAIKVFCRIFTITVHSSDFSTLRKAERRQNFKLSHGMQLKEEWDFHVCVLYQEGLIMAVLEGSTF